MARDPFVVKKAFRRNSNVDGLFRKFSNFSNLEGVRVKSIILDDSTIEGWAALGAIEYQSINSNFTARAYPLNSNSKCFPLINEIVYIISLPSSDMNKANTRKKTYYISNVGIWNHPHHNAFPPNPDNLTETQRDDYVSKGQDTDTTEDDVTVRQIQDSTGIYLGKTFKERSNIHPLLPFEGDFIQEGRWGNSLRFGSTVKNKNNWSDYGTNGDPITILKNGQSSNVSSEGFLPITEDINTDPTSIYLTSTQQIPIDIAVATTAAGQASTVPFSDVVTNTPTSPRAYNKPQVILNSGRLLFNSNIDSIMLSSKKSVILQSVEDLGIKSSEGNVNILSGKGVVSLGAKNSSQAVMLGDNFWFQFDTLLASLELLCKTLNKESSIPMAASQALFTTDTIAKIRQNKENVLSQKVKTS